jgi:hypothetical protein
MTRRTQTLIAFVATVLMVILMAKLGQPMDATPYRITAFELAKTPEKAQEIITTWQPSVTKAAYLQTQVDFLFILAYTAFAYLWSLFLTENSPQAVIRRLGSYMSWAAIVAGGCDVIENLCMFPSLSNNITDFYTETAFYTAAIKFSLLALVFVVCIVLGIRRWFGGYS